MQMPNLGDQVFVCPTAENIERSPCSRQFLPVGVWTPATVTDHIARRILDGAVLWAYKAPESPALKKASKKESDA